MTQHLLNECKDVQTQYTKKRQILDEWNEQFQKLDHDVAKLSLTFEQLYEQSEVTDAFQGEIKEKLENRREGIRLSVKSASRLQRRLNIEKPLEAKRVEVLLDDEVVTKLASIESKLTSFTEGSDDTVLSEPDMEELADEPSKTVDNQNDDNTDTNSSVDPKQNGVSDETESIVERVERTVLETTKLEAEEEPSLSDVSEDPNLTVFLQELIEKYEETIQDLDQAIEGAEKRFLSFIEKSVAPILDGLYSGQVYGSDLLAELKTSGHENLENVEEWLTVYNTFMREVQMLFDTYSVDVYIPTVGEAFDEYTHDPIGVVEDASFEDEQVKEIVRYGLLYKREIFGQENFLIRPAQVIVVKNQNLTDKQGE